MKLIEFQNLPQNKKTTYIKKLQEKAKKNKEKLSKNEKEIIISIVKQFTKNT